MKQLGRRLYYDKLTGNVILDTGEMAGDVVEPTTDQDFQAYAALSGRVQDTVCKIVLPFGQDREKFGVYAYHVDLIAQTIVWDLTPIQQEEAAKQVSIEERLTAAEDAILTLMLTQPV